MFFESGAQSLPFSPLAVTIPPHITSDPLLHPVRAALASSAMSGKRMKAVILGGLKSLARKRVKFESSTGDDNSRPHPPSSLPSVPSTPSKQRIRFDFSPKKAKPQTQGAVDTTPIPFPPLSSEPASTSQATRRRIASRPRMTVASMALSKERDSSDDSEDEKDDVGLEGEARKKYLVRR